MLLLRIVCGTTRLRVPACAASSDPGESKVQAAMSFAWHALVICTRLHCLHRSALLNKGGITQGHESTPEGEDHRGSLQPTLGHKQFRVSEPELPV